MANPLNQNLRGKVVLLDAEHLRDGVTDRRFLCEAGFGCLSFTQGTKIMGRFVGDGERATIDSRMIEGLAEEQAEDVKGTVKA